MKPRHAAALALIGWYLMVPPMCADHPVPAWCRESTDPVGKWTIRDSFVTEAECKAKLSSWRGRTRQLLPCSGTDDLRACWNSLSPLRQRISSDWEDAVSAECIAADDPRLKKKTPRAQNLVSTHLEARSLKRPKDRTSTQPSLIQYHYSVDPLQLRYSQNV